MFTPAPFLSFLTALNLRSHLVQSKLYSYQRTTGSYKCNSLRCQVVKECYQFPSHVTEETFKINHYFDCTSRSLIYMISCKVCGKQYVVSAMKRFRLWWNNTSLAKEKLKEGRTVYKSIFMNNFWVRITNVSLMKLKLFLSIKLTYRILLEESNSAELR